MKLFADLLACFLTIGSCFTAYAHPADEHYAELINSKKYTLKVHIENKTILDSFNSRIYEERALAENIDQGIEAVDIITSNPTEKKPYTHRKYMKIKGAYGGGSKEGKTLEAIEPISIKMDSNYMNFDVQSFRGSKELFIISKSELLKYFGPIYTKTGRDNNYQVSYVGNGEMNLQNIKYYYEEYALVNEPGAKLRMLYQGNELKRILKILTRKNDTGFILGVQREKNSFVDIIIKEFSSRLDDILLNKERKEQ